MRRLTAAEFAPSGRCWAEGRRRRVCSRDTIKKTEITKPRTNWNGAKRQKKEKQRIEKRNECKHTKVSHANLYTDGGRSVGSSPSILVLMQIFEEDEIKGNDENLHTHARHVRRGHTWTLGIVASRRHRITGVAILCSSAPGPRWNDLYNECVCVCASIDDDRDGDTAKI